jgi:hypothetical protein
VQSLVVAHELYAVPLPLVALVVVDAAASSVDAVLVALAVMTALVALAVVLVAFVVALVVTDTAVSRAHAPSLQRKPESQSDVEPQKCVAGSSFAIFHVLLLVVLPASSPSSPDDSIDVLVVVVVESSLSSVAADENDDCESSSAWWNARGVVARLAPRNVFDPPLDNDASVTNMALNTPTATTRCLRDCFPGFGFARAVPPSTAP